MQAVWGKPASTEPYRTLTRPKKYGTPKDAYMPTCTQRLLARAKALRRPAVPIGWQPAERQEKATAQVIQPANP